MKNKLSILISFSLIIIGFGFYSCEKELDRPPIKELDETKILTIKDLYDIQAENGDDYVFVDEYMLFATVVMDDSSGNIYKEAYLQDSTAGINVYKISHAGALEVGQYVRINLKGSSLKNYSGKMELIFADVLDFRKSMVVQKYNQYIEPAEARLDEIYEGKWDCQLVKLKNVEFIPADTSKTYANLGGNSSQNRSLRDCTGKTVIIRTNDRSKFAGNPLPTGNGDAIGVITKFINNNNVVTWQLLVRDPEEIMLNNPRCGS
ncbi:MAG: DUF5689 domain-containing protein [Bacteroidales bacterium]|jgi:hypothetical protein|nr:DUF5689 domain-containing protein [Bacteroidales bacterium]MCK9499798.1 DUF5689 domain-containing protein [Bacteroidales bacterium]MDY0314607.1 DUF5689 domain-containing protein [Bacteroidales bacterium]